MEGSQVVMVRCFRRRSKTKNKKRWIATDDDEESKQGWTGAGQGAYIHTYIHTYIEHGLHTIECRKES